MSKAEKAALDDANKLIKLEKSIKERLENLYGYKETFENNYPEAWTFPIEKSATRQVPIAKAEKAIYLGGGALLVVATMNQLGWFDRLKKNAKVVDLQRRIQEEQEKIQAKASEAADEVVTRIEDLKPNGDID